MIITLVLTARIVGPGIIISMGFWNRKQDTGYAVFDGRIYIRMFTRHSWERQAAFIASRNKGATCFRLLLTSF